MIIMNIKCKVINIAKRLVSIAYECAPLASILLIVMPIAISCGHDAVSAWLWLCGAWSVCHIVIGVCKYPYEQSNGVDCVNPNLESDEQKHKKGQRVLHVCVEAISINLAFTCWYWIPIIYGMVYTVILLPLANFLAGVWGI